MAATMTINLFSAAAPVLRSAPVLPAQTQQNKLEQKLTEQTEKMEFFKKSVSVISVTSC
jgi:hypothetical protein